MKPLRLVVLLLVGVFTFPQCAQANAGTPLMWAGFLHLVFGNALIGLGEGLLIGWLFSRRKLPCVLVMVAANYFSAWIGRIFIIDAIVHVLPLDLYNAWGWFWIMLAAAYAMTLVLEWPFVALCFFPRFDQRKPAGRIENGTVEAERPEICKTPETPWLKRSILASLVVQSASYVLLCLWYGGVSGTSLYTRMNVVEPAEISLPASVVVFYIDPTDGNVYKRPLVGGDAERVSDLHERYAHLFFRPSKTDAARWDLTASLGNYNEPRLVDLLSNQQVEPPMIEDNRDKELFYEGRWSYGGDAKLGDAASSPWTFTTGFWPIDGLRATNRDTGESVRFAYETPFGEWYISNAVHLPTDKVLFQLGNDQICVFDPIKRRVALLWRGRSPTAVIEKKH